MSEGPQYRIEALDTSRHRREAFSCESLALTEFLQKRARKEMEARVSACFVLVEENDLSRILGYYTLLQTSVSLQELPDSLIRRLPRYPELGATLIGRLARDLAWRGKAVGPLLLVDALRRCARASREVGSVVVVTDPKDLKAKSFYESFGFRALDQRRLFIPMKDVLEMEARDWNA